MNAIYKAIVAIGIGALMVSAHAADAPQEDLAASGIEWHVWSPAAFDEAKRDHKLVLLHLGAGWCHWCHVMEHVTYRDPAVDKVLHDHFVAIHVDQDSRPDLANRYEEYGWPATILFDASGNELVKWQGYIPPERMQRLLEATVKDPTPGPSVVAGAGNTNGTNSSLDAARRMDLERQIIDRYDEKAAGWGTVHKYLTWDILEYEMGRARAGDEAAGNRVRVTLAAARQLIDPVWGGLYQYSTDGDWVHPHFEKIMQFQEEGIRIYAMAYSLWHDPADLKAAKDIERFLETFLSSPQGAFYTSQDADVVPGQHSADYFAMDDAGRRKIGVPRVDRHEYARENGWAICGLVALYDATGESSYLQRAERAEMWGLEHRANGDGFRHDEIDSAGPYLGDTLAMAQAELSLYQATAVRDHLARSEAALRFIDAHFRQERSAGYLTAQQSDSDLVAPTPEFDENVALARLSNLIYQYTGRDEFRSMADRAMRFLIAMAPNQSHELAATLLANEEMSREPIHIAILAAQNDPVGRELDRSALAAGLPYLRIEVIDPSGPASARKDVEYPSLAHAAAFLCTNGACSTPVESAKQLQELIARRVNHQ